MKVALEFGKKILKKSFFGPKSSKVGSKSVKLAQNSDPLEIEGFSEDFGQFQANSKDWKVLKVSQEFGKKF